MTNPFDSPKELIQGAYESLSEFHAASQAYIKKRPYTKVTEFDPETGWNIVKIRLTENVPNKINRLATHIFQDLRSTLDQIGFACAKAGGNSRLKKTYFPFADSIDNLDHVIARRCKDIPPDIVAFFRTFKPYKGGDDLLWALNRVTSTQKHCTIVPFAKMVEGRAFGSIVAVSGGDKPIRHDVNSEWNPDKNEIELYAVRKGAVALDITNMAFNIVIGDIEVIKGMPASNVLAEIGKRVDNILVATEAKARSLGIV